MFFFWGVWCGCFVNFLNGVYFYVIGSWYFFVCFLSCLYDDVLFGWRICGYGCGVEIVVIVIGGGVIIIFVYSVIEEFVDFVMSNFVYKCVYDGIDNFCVEYEIYSKGIDFRCEGVFF